MSKQPAVSISTKRRKFLEEVESVNFFINNLQEPPLEPSTSIVDNSVPQQFNIKELHDIKLTNLFLNEPLINNYDDSSFYNDLFCNFEFDDNASINILDDKHTKILKLLVN